MISVEDWSAILESLRAQLPRVSVSNGARLVSTMRYGALHVDLSVSRRSMSAWVGWRASRGTVTALGMKSYNHQTAAQFYANLGDAMQILTHREERWKRKIFHAGWGSPEEIAAAWGAYNSQTETGETK